MLDQEFVTMPQILETGTSMVSPHVRWLLRHAITQHCGQNAVNQISYCKDIPLDKAGNRIWGETFSPCKAMALNLEQHFDSCIEQVQDEDKMNTSLRLLLIRELLDTAIHESHHLKASYTTGDFANSGLEEKEAKKVAWKQSWMAAKHWDVEVVNFGPVLDVILEDFFQTLKADTLETPTMWKDLQLYMWENGLAYYDPDKDMECNMREAFESMANDDNPWLDDPKQFMVTVIEEAGENLEQKEVETVLPPETPNPPVTASPEEQTPAVNLTGEESQYVPDALEQQAAIDGYVVPPPPGSESSVVPPPPEPVAEVPAPPAPAATPSAPAMDANVLRIQTAVELVTRRLFAHVMTKCGFNTEGTYNNPAAVLEPINIADIPDALELFSHMDTTDATGVYAANQPCQGFIKGLVSQQNFPMYRFYLNIGGQMHKRSLLPQNPQKVDQHKQFTTWAQAAQDGDRIMMLMEEGRGPRASVKLDAGVPFGQEEFKIWPAKPVQQG